MEQVDQEARKALVDLLRAPATPDSAAMALVQARVDCVDVGNTARLQQLIRRYDWPSRRRVGRDGADAAFLLAQHADRAPEFQTRYLSFLRKAFRAGEEEGDHLALLTDRVRRANGLKQLYGTQAEVVNGRVRFLPIADSMQVDERRATLELIPLQEYKRILENMYTSEAPEAGDSGSCNGGGRSPP